MPRNSPIEAPSPPLRLWVGFVTLAFMALVVLPERSGPLPSLSSMGRIRVIQSPVVAVRGHGGDVPVDRREPAQASAAPKAALPGAPPPTTAPASSYDLASIVRPAPSSEAPTSSEPSPPPRKAVGPPRFRVVLDPGHGGKPEPADRSGGAHWDPVAKRFWNPYRFGCAHREGRKTLTEHALVLDLALRVEKLLALTLSDPGWMRFRQLLSRHGVPMGGKDWPRALLDTRLSRRSDYKSHPKRREKNVNRFFRLFDSPESFPATMKTPIHPGRISQINAWAPQLVVCLHINGAANPKLRGMNALFVPSHAIFEEARKVIVGKAKKMSRQARLVKRFWRFADSSRTKRGWMFNDTWTYFTGCGAVPNGRTQDPSVNVSMRWNQLSWAYRDPIMPPVPESLDRDFNGPFWTRERSEAEKQRRSGGAEGLGGDNLLAGQELLRYVRKSLWLDYENRGVSFASREVSPRTYLGPHHAPTAADWAMLLFSNAVVAYLELGYLSNSSDRWLLTRRADVIAEGLAVGIYSLCMGLQPRLHSEVPAPRGLAIDWKRYSGHGTSHFEAARSIRGASVSEGKAP